MQPSTRPCLRRLRRELSHISAQLQGSHAAIQEGFAKQYLRDQAALDRGTPKRLFASAGWRKQFGGGMSSDSRGRYRSFASNLWRWHPQRKCALDNKATAPMATSIGTFYLRRICCGLRASMLVGVASVVAGGPIGAAAGLTANAAIAESANFIANYVTPVQDFAVRLHAMATEACRRLA